MIWYYGISSLICQTILLRELAALTKGNEIIIGILLFSWLIGTGLGSALFRHLPISLKNSKKMLPGLLVSTHLIFLILIFVIRSLFPYFSYHALPNIFILFLLSLVCVLPVSLLTGFFFTGVVFQRPVTTVSILYIIEAFATFLGGLLFTFLVAGNIDAVTVSIIFSILSLFFLILKVKIPLRVFILIFIVGLALSVQYMVPLSRAFQFKEAKVFDSKYASVALVKSKNLETLYYGGSIIANIPHPPSDEETVHIPALVHGNPKTILLIGFAPPGVIEELKRYSPSKITHVFEDPALNIMQREVVHVDPYLWLKQTEDKFDLILLHTALSSTIGENRFFSLDFYKEVARHLKPNGIFSFNIPYEENLTSPHTREIINIIYHTLSNAFSSVKIIPAGNFHFTASLSKISSEKTVVLKRLKTKGFSLQTINPSYIEHYFAPSRNTRFLSMIEAVSETFINYRNDLLIYKSYLKNWFIKNLSDSWLVIVAIMIVIVILIGKYRREIISVVSGTRRSIVLFSIGFTGILGELLLLTLYQNTFGHIYYMWGLLISLFMLGIGSGALYRKFTKGRGILPAFIGWFLLIELLHYVYFVHEVIFIMMAVGGILIGALFNEFALFEERKLSPNEVVSANLYSYDLFGSATASLIGGWYLIPFVGHTPIIIGSIILWGVMSWKKAELKKY